MSFEDLVEARAKRTEKEAGKVAKNKGTHGTKRKGGAARVARFDEAPDLDRTLVLVAETQHLEGLTAPGPGRAPVARMW